MCSASMYMYVLYATELWRIFASCILVNAWSSVATPLKTRWKYILVVSFLYFTFCISCRCASDVGFGHSFVFFFECASISVLVTGFPLGPFSRGLWRCDPKLGVAVCVCTKFPYSMATSRKALRCQKITTFLQPVHDTVAEELPHKESKIEEPCLNKSKHWGTGFCSNWLEEFGWLHYDVDSWLNIADWIAVIIWSSVFVK